MSAVPSRGSRIWADALSMMRICQLKDAIGFADYDDPELPFLVARLQAALREGDIAVRYRPRVETALTRIHAASWEGRLRAKEQASSMVSLMAPGGNPSAAPTAKNVVLIPLADSMPAATREILIKAAHATGVDILLDFRTAADAEQFIWERGF